MLDRIRNFFTPARRKAIYVAATAAGVVLVTLDVVTPEQIDGAVRTVTLVAGSLITLMAALNTAVGGGDQ